MPFTKLKASLRKAAAPTNRQTPVHPIAREARNYFRHAGYE
jgi:hypothetical protein